MLDQNIIQKVLWEYGISPQLISKHTDLLYRATDGNKQYAVKRSQLNQNTVQFWEYVYHTAHTQRLSSVLPVYVTKSGALFHAAEESIYYVTPWIEATSHNKQTQITGLFKALGHLHESTRHTADVDIQESELKFADYERHLLSSYERLSQYITLFESQHYMSPFELQTCTHYVHIDMIFNLLFDRLKTFIAQLQNDPAQTVSLCHGQMSLQHYIYHHRPYVINWEKANYGHPMNDLAKLIQDAGSRHDPNTTMWSHSLQTYFDTYASTSNERLLLSIYLLDPTAYINMIESYVTKGHAQPMLEYVHSLEQLYRRLTLALHLVETIDEMNREHFEEDDPQFRDEI
ncbi:phosphotransferase [Lentibacillus sp. JNUCC-1]|uniref:phosphotransferase n=1 Tax=Lentibacillus sp. JNUCC-1 TaxID=2654513 RepID=UPI0018D24F8F